MLQLLLKGEKKRTEEIRRDKGMRTVTPTSSVIILNRNKNGMNITFFVNENRN